MEIDRLFLCSLDILRDLRLLLSGALFRGELFAARHSFVAGGCLGVDLGKCLCRLRHDSHTTTIAADWVRPDLVPFSIRTGSKLCLGLIRRVSLERNSGSDVFSNCRVGYRGNRGALYRPGIGIDNRLATGIIRHGDDARRKQFLLTRDDVLVIELRAAEVGVERVHLGGVFGRDGSWRLFFRSGFA